MQELLNRSDERLWGIVSNGLELRLLRDNSSLTRQAYVEFDLEAMIDGEVYADFVAALARSATPSRVEGERPHECWLERWTQEAQKQGTRALDRLRDGVEAAITALGAASSPTRRTPRCETALRAGELSTAGLLPRAAAPRLPAALPLRRRGPRAAARPRARRARRASATRAATRPQRLRRLAERRRGTQHGDL